ncbi:MAG: phosphoribosylformylglycinamidine synthase subunit PurQ, partial [SAR324 cluster bacterium]|nr:phosphoribosylformylglycinamidine synthase subunit PurQ [SAR324 cluster bacterium]
NPNGSPFGIASLCNPQGTVMGLMPHPEAFNHYTNHPRWTRRPPGGRTERPERTETACCSSATPMRICAAWGDSPGR